MFFLSLKNVKNNLKLIIQDKVEKKSMKQKKLLSF